MTPASASCFVNFTCRGYTIILSAASRRLCKAAGAVPMIERLVLDTYLCVMSPVIRPVLLSEVNVLTAISRSTFTDAFAATNTPENMFAYMDVHLTAPVLATEWNTAGSSFYFIGSDTEIMGYLKLNTGAAQKEEMDAGSMELERIYISRPYWAMGLGQQLLDFALDTAVAAGMRRLWLGVWEYNERALRFYHKNGFTVFGKHLFVMGDDPQTDILMERLL